jgi:hypothetical protein
MFDLFGNPRGTVGAKVLREVVEDCLQVITSYGYHAESKFRRKMSLYREFIFVCKLS